MGTDATCPFCAIIAGEQEATRIYETTEYCCFLDKYPVTDGHALAVSKAHVESLDAADSQALFAFVDTARAKIQERFDPDAMNLGINDGPAAGQTIPHLHWHLIPRYEGDIPNPEGGVRGVIPDKRTYQESS